MRVVISDVSGGTPPVVLFECALGSGRGRWMVGKPSLDTDNDVEFTMPLLRWGEQIFMSDQNQPRIAVANDQVLMTSLIESVDVHGVLTLRLGESLVLVDTKGVRAEPGTWIDVRPSALDLYDTNT